MFTVRPLLARSKKYAQLAHTPIFCGLQDSCLPDRATPGIRVAVTIIADWYAHFVVTLPELRLTDVQFPV